MRARVTTLVALILALSAVSALAQEYGKIEGFVLAKGTTVANARVVIKGTKFVSQTDASGKFVLDQVPPGRYEITAECPGYAPATLANVRVRKGSTTTINLYLNPLTRVRGVVTDAQTGDPVRDAVVVLSARGEQQAGAKTDEKGRFEIPRTDLDRSLVYTVTVSAGGYRTWTKQEVFSDPDNFLKISLEPQVELRSVTIPIRYRPFIAALIYARSLVSERGRVEATEAGAIKVEDVPENLPKIRKALEEFDRLVRMWLEVALIRATERGPVEGLEMLPQKVVKQLRSLFRYRGYQVLDSGGTEIFEGFDSELTLAGGSYKLQLGEIEFVEGKPRVVRMKVTLHSTKRGIVALGTTANVPVGDTVILGGSRAETPAEALITVLSVRELK